MAEMNTNIYNELREKIALAAEVQLCLFLNDNQLKELTTTLYWCF